MGVKYRNLDVQIYKKGLKKKFIAKELGITPKALSNKISGKAPFTWEQVCFIHNKYFSDIPKEILFASSYENKKTSERKN